MPSSELFRLASKIVNACVTMPTSFPGFSPTRPTARARERERPWKTLVTWLRNKIKFWGRSPCLTLFLSGLFATFTTFTQWSQQQDRFSNPTTTITETAWPNSTRIHFLSPKSSKKILLKIVFTVTQKKKIYIYIGNRPVKEAKNMKCY